MKRVLKPAGWIGRGKCDGQHIWEYEGKLYVACDAELHLDCDDRNHEPLYTATQFRQAFEEFAEMMEDPTRAQIEISFYVEEARRRAKGW